MSQKQSVADKETERFMEKLIKKDPSQPEFHQAVHEVISDVMPLVLERDDYQRFNILERITEPDRIVTFRVTWEDDKNNTCVNRAWRVQFNNSIGPYKGGMRFHPTVNLGVLKFLGFEQVFKNSLTGLPMGGAKGGSNFDPKGRSDHEVMRFCQALMAELLRHIGSNTDVPAGDIGVGGREIGFMFGQFKRLANRFTGTLTGKGITYGGSLIRTEATGYGAVYFMKEMLEHRSMGLTGKTALVSGSGNVAQYCVEKLNQLGVKVLTLSDSNGFIHDPNGIDEEKLKWVIDLKEKRRGRIREYVDAFKGSNYFEGKRPWGVKADLAFPCATQNEIDGNDAKTLLENKCIGVSEGANMPSTYEAVKIFNSHRIAYGPSKAANAGGVAVSGLEQSQNALRISWTRQEVDERLRAIMHSIHARCVEHGDEKQFVNYVKGANRAGFLKVADAMVAYGVV